MKVLTLILSTFLLFTSFAHAGTESGGGGGVVFIKNQPALLDYFNVFNESEIDQSNPVHAKLPYLKFSLSSKSLRTIKKDMPAFDLAISIMEKWESLYFDQVSGRIRSAFGAPLKWNFTDAPVKHPDFFRPALLPKDKDIHTAAYYFADGNKNFTVNIYLPIWEQMSLEHQAGLLIHEALRQIQIGQNQSFTEEGLQQATMIYLLCKPKARLNFYLMHTLNENPESAQKIYGSFSQVMKDSCKRIEHEI